MKTQITTEAEAAFWKSKETKKQIKNFRKIYSAPDDDGFDFDDDEIEDDIKRELTASMMELFGYDDEAEFDDDYFSSIGTPLDEIIGDVVDDILTARDAKQAERFDDLVDHIRDIIVSDNEVESANGILLYQALQYLAVEALLGQEEGSVLFQKLNETTLEYAEETQGISYSLELSIED